MRAYTKNGFEYFYDRYQKLWVLYPVDKNGNRIEWDKNDNPIEAQYFITRDQVEEFLKTKA